ncbi:MAG: type II toxin-antitoxin system prevent-host-death family antitoxin [Mariprofundaceae bacterium]
MKKIAAAAFKAKCLSLLDEVSRSHEELIITKRGKPVARLVAANDEHSKVNLRGSVLAEKDIMKPVDELWEASS